MLKVTIKVQNLHIFFCKFHQT